MVQNHYFMILNDNYNLSLFLLLPLATEEGKAEDYLDGYESALMNAFHYDINKPYLDNHIHLVFDTSMFRTIEVNTITNDNKQDKISHYRISGVFVRSYAIKIKEEYLSSRDLILEDKIFNLQYEIKIKIFKFWDLKADSKLFKVLFEEPKESTNIKTEILPEEDYVEDDFDYLNVSFGMREESW